MPLYNQETSRWAEQVAHRFEAKLRKVRGRTADKIPSGAFNGLYDDKLDGRKYPPTDGIFWWTNGFWPGLMWQAFHATGEQEYADVAQAVEENFLW